MIDRVGSLENNARYGPILEPCATRYGRSQKLPRKTFHIRKDPEENIHGPRAMSCDLIANLITSSFSAAELKMASASLLAVPAKTTKSVDFAQPFSRFVANNYDEQPTKYQEAIREVNSLRESTVVKTPDRHETGLDLITR